MAEPKNHDNIAEALLDGSSCQVTENDQAPVVTATEQSPYQVSE